MKIFDKVLFLVMLCTVLAVIVKAYKSINVSATDMGINFIRERTTSSGTLLDPLGEVAVNSIEDVHLFVTADNVQIDYGRIQLIWNYEDFLDEVYDTPLEAIGITREVRPSTGELIVYYHGEELPRRAR